MITMGSFQPIKFYNPMILLMPAQKIKFFLMLTEPDYLEIFFFLNSRLNSLVIGLHQRMELH